MKIAFKKALKLFSYLSVVFTVSFWIYMIYDDYIFIEKYGLNAEYVGGWLVWYLAYFIVFALYYWIISSSLILIYYKLIRGKVEK
jgi:hypothetical protein